MIEEPADLVKTGFRPPAKNRKKIAPEIGPEIGPAERIGKKKIKTWKILIFPCFFPFFPPGPTSGQILGAIFS